MDYFTRQDCRRLDSDAIAAGVPSILLMEHAALGATWVAEQLLGSLRGKRMWILCGPGNNGGDGYAMARLCHNAGAEVFVRDLVSPDKIDPSSDPGLNSRALDALPRVTRSDSVVSADLIIDSIFGTGLTRPAEGRYADAIQIINESDAPILAIDIPSGLDCDTGEPLGPTVKARATATFGLPKIGFQKAAAASFVGDLYLVPIGVPRESLPEGIPASGKPQRI